MCLSVCKIVLDLGMVGKSFLQNTQSTTNHVEEEPMIIGADFSLLYYYMLPLRELQYTFIQTNKESKPLVFACVQLHFCPQTVKKLLKLILRSKILKKKTPGMPEIPRVIGAPRGTRTHNLLIRSQALYPIELAAHKSCT